MKCLLGLAVAATAFVTAILPVSSQEQVGQATLVRTAVTGDGGPIVVRSPVHRDERIRTSSAGLGEFIFRDGTKFAVGGNSSVVIDRFVYDGSQNFDKLTLSAARGSFRWISGKSKSEAYEIVTPAGTIGIRGTKLELFVNSAGKTAVVLLSGAARFCTPRGCEDLRRRCDVIVANPGGGVSDASRVNTSIFETMGTNNAFPFLSGKQRLSSGFQGFGTTSCGLSRAASKTPPTQGGEAPRERPDPPNTPDPPDDCSECGGDF
jgi:hypothetical protein